MEKCKSLELPNIIYVMNLRDYLFNVIVGRAFIRAQREILKKKVKFEELDDQSLNEFFSQEFKRISKRYFELFGEDNEN